MTCSQLPAECSTSSGSNYKVHTASMMPCQNLGDFNYIIIFIAYESLKNIYNLLNSIIKIIYYC